MKTDIKPAQGRKLVKFRNCFCGVQAEKFLDGSFLCRKHWEFDRLRLLQDPDVTAANIKASNARSEKARYTRLKSAGICVTCGSRPNYFGCVRCEECQAQRRAYRGKLVGGSHRWKNANHSLFTQKP